ncbi:hypothetical protein K040078D81_43940 [Blautia hominis]|uniref:Uncharacterized protein n=1 Tax=Blautia hominis TaxID=2025493 RepID=A0ABQ0BFQ0_9FIRM
MVGYYHSTKVYYVSNVFWQADNSHGTLIIEYQYGDIFCIEYVINDMKNIFKDTKHPAHLGEGDERK